MTKKEAFLFLQILIFPGLVTFYTMNCYAILQLAAILGWETTTLIFTLSIFLIISHYSFMLFLWCVVAGVRRMSFENMEAER